VQNQPLHDGIEARMKETSSKLPTGHELNISGVNLIPDNPVGVAWQGGA